MEVSVGTMQTPENQTLNAWRRAENVPKVSARLALARPSKTGNGR
jgi:hypothetical protein